MCFFLFVPKTYAKYSYETEITVTTECEIPEFKFEIYTYEDLVKFRELMNETKKGFKGINVYLMNDIEIPDNPNIIYTTWNKIGTENKPFCGNFYGNNHTISNFKIDVFGNGIGDYSGFFARNDGTIQDLTLSRRNERIC